MDYQIVRVLLFHSNGSSAAAYSFPIRILPSSHTNPIFVEVGGKPVRAFRRSIEWCLKSVDQCWKNKERFMKGEEFIQARVAYDHALVVYRKRLAECEWD